MKKKFIGLDDRGYVTGEPTQFVEVQDEPTMNQIPNIEEEEFNFKAIKEYWGLHVGPKSGQHMQEKVLFKIYEKLQQTHHQQLQKARADSYVEGYVDGIGVSGLNMPEDKKEELRQSIIDRYHSELDQDNN